MEEFLNEVVPDVDLKKYEQIYFEQLRNEKGTVSIKSLFEYACCLVQSKYPADIKKGILLLENAYCKDVSGRRDYLFYMAVGNYRIKEYSKALEHCRTFLEREPSNKQVQSLQEVIMKKMNDEGKMGMAITLGGLALFGALISLGVALTRK